VICSATRPGIPSFGTADERPQLRLRPPDPAGIYRQATAEILCVPQQAVASMIASGRHGMGCPPAALKEQLKEEPQQEDILIIERDVDTL
jgi:hypothetical protein